MLTTAGTVIFQFFNVPNTMDLMPRYNIAPGQEAPIVRIEHGARRLTNARWGLVPPWARDRSIGARLINARSETVATKPAFTSAFRARRCLVAADGFYEWRREGRTRQPYCIRFLDRRPFGIAGLWESWQAPGRPIFETFTILTTAPNTIVAPLHNRMPVIIDPRDHDLWLDPQVHAQEALQPLFRPFPADEMEAWPVSRLVNDPHNEGPRCLDSPIE